MIDDHLMLISPSHSDEYCGAPCCGVPNSERDQLSIS
jgi:hypothetical protein